MQLMHRTPTRRHVILVCAGALSLQAQITKVRTTIHQEVDFKAPPARIYDALLDAKQFSALTESPAEIQRQPGGMFKLFDGHIEGRHIELVSNRRIVQAWREISWPAGMYTLAKFELTPRGSGTRLVFDQTGIAEDDVGHLSEGWPFRYWEPLRKYLDGRSK